jgi:hypothetical protein
LRTLHTIEFGVKPIHFCDGCRRSKFQLIHDVFFKNSHVDMTIITFDCLCKLRIVHTFLDSCLGVLLDKDLDLFLSHVFLHVGLKKLILDVISHWSHVFAELGKGSCMSVNWFDVLRAMSVVAFSSVFNEVIKVVGLSSWDGVNAI